MRTAGTPWDDGQAREQVARAETLLSGLETLPDTAAEQAIDTVEALVALYGGCLARIMERIARCADPAVMDDLAADELVSHLLLVHDLHPEPVDTRVRRALEEVRPFLRSHGGDVELLDVQAPQARVRIRISRRGCGSSPAELERAVQDAVTGAAPEIERVEAESGPAPAPGTLIPVDALFQGVDR